MQAGGYTSEPSVSLKLKMWLVEYSKLLAGTVDSLRHQPFDAN